MKYLLIALAAALLGSAGTAGAAATGVVTLQPGQHTVIGKTRVNCQAAKGNAIRFSGSGTRKLPVFSTNADSTLHWTNDGPRFQIFPYGASRTVAVNSSGPSGSAFLVKGTYRLQINAVGNWTITIR